MIEDSEKVANETLPGGKQPPFFNHAAGTKIGRYVTKVALERSDLVQHVAYTVKRMEAAEAWHGTDEDYEVLIEHVAGLLCDLRIDREVLKRELVEGVE